MKTTLESGEIVAAIHFPASVAGTRSRYEKLGDCPATGAAICGVAAMVTRGKDDGDTVYRLFVVRAHGTRGATKRKVEAALMGPEADRKQHRISSVSGGERGASLRLRLPARPQNTGLISHGSLWSGPSAAQLKRKE